MTHYLRSFSFWPFIVMQESFQGTEDELPKLAHEMEHYRRQRWWSPLWVLLYFMSKRFRFREEKAAYASEIRKRQELGQRVDYDWYVRAMSEKYRGMCTREEAEEFVSGLR
jgi:hypothetical protein